MKKMIAFLVVFALITGAAFAQANLGGQLQMGMVLLEGNNVKDEDITSGGSYGGSFVHEAKYSVTFGDGKGGGRLVFNTAGSMWGWLQWRPSQLIGVKIGSDGDGSWGFPQIAGWGFTGEAKNSVAAYSDYNGSLAMRYRNTGLNYGGFDGAGAYHAALSIYPHDLVEVHLLSRDMATSSEIGMRLARLQLITRFIIEDIGTVRFAFVGQGGLAPDDDGKLIPGSNIGDMFLAFHSSSLIPNLGLEVGVKFNLPRVEDSDTMDNIHFSLGLNYTNEDFGLKIRGGAAAGGKSGGDALPTGLGIHILPNYRINPDAIFFFHAGLGMELVEDVDPTYHWFVNPYIWVRASEGLRFWAGIQIIDNRATDPTDFHYDKFKFDWKIPFGFNFYF